MTQSSTATKITPDTKVKLTALRQARKETNERLAQTLAELRALKTQLTKLSVQETKLRKRHTTLDQKIFAMEKGPQIVSIRKTTLAPTPKITTKKLNALTAEIPTNQLKDFLAAKLAKYQATN